MSVPLNSPVDGLANFWNDGKKLCFASSLSSVYAVTGFPFDVRTANRQIGKTVSVVDCIKSNGLALACSTAFIRELWGLTVATNVRKLIYKKVDSEFWDRYQDEINFICGASRASADALIGNPIVIAKQMVYTGQVSNGRQALKKRYAEAGSAIDAFYRRTFHLMLTRNVLASGLQFATFAKISTKDDSTLVQVVKGGTTNAVLGLLTFPLDRVRNSIITDPSRLNLRGAVRNIYLKYGVLGFYSGYSPVVCKMFASGAVSSFGMKAMLDSTLKKKN